MSATPHSITVFNNVRRVTRRLNVVVRRLPWFAILTGCLFASVLITNGVPSVKHDWQWPASRAAAAFQIVDAYSGWDSSGFGAPQPRMTNFIVKGLVAAVTALTSPAIGFFIFCAIVLGTVSSGAYSLARSLGAGTLLARALSIVAICNAWVYTEIVAGHMFMVLSYGATFHLVALAKQSHSLTAPQITRRCALLMVLIMTQLQYIPLALAIIAVIGVRKRRALQICGTSVLVLIPLIIGVIAERGSIKQTPLTLSWEDRQSVGVVIGAALRGYFAHYDVDAGGTLASMSWILAVTVAAYALVAVRSNAGRSFVALALASLLAASGTNGPIAPLARFLFTNVPEAGVFRELYDLIGYVALAYCGILSIASRQSPVRAKIVVAVSLGLACSWLVTPPCRQWVDQVKVLFLAPLSAETTVPPNSRIAFFPPFQPFSFFGEGSGLDPLRVAGGDGVAPLDDYIGSYPGNAALAKYGIQGSEEDLRALSVSMIVRRPGFQEVTGDHIIAMPARSRIAVEPVRRIANYSAELDRCRDIAAAVIARPRDRCSTGFDSQDDARIAESMRRANWIVAQRDALEDDPGRGWVDARLLFRFVPEAAQSIGGVGTRGSKLLSLRSGRTILLWTSASTVTLNGRSVHVVSNRYQWLPLTSADTALGCRNWCIVAGSVSTPPQLPIELPRPARIARGDAALKMWLPFIGTYRLVSAQQAYLRYNARFDPGWYIIENGVIVRSSRVSGVANAFRLNAGQAAHEGLLFHLPSVLQFISAVAITIAMLPIAMSILADRRKESSLEGEDAIVPVIRRRVS